MKYTKAVGDKTFTGKIQRSLPLQDVIEMLETSYDVQIKVTGNKITL